MHRFTISFLIIAGLALTGCGNPQSELTPQTSTQTSFGQAAATPRIASISPLSAVVGSPDVTLTIAGTNFTPPQGSTSSIAIWTGSGTSTELSTKFVSSTQITVLIPAALLQVAGTATVSVTTGDVMGISGGVSYPNSNAVFNVIAAAGGNVDFLPAGTMSTSRSFHTATLLPDSRVLVAAGGTWKLSPDCITALATAEVYDPSTHTFVPTGDLTTPRYGHTATLLLNGKVLITGGGPDCSPGVNSTELYDPVSGTFSAGPAMSARRAFHSATLLANGRVLVAGGWPQDGGSTAELYDPATGQFGPAKSMTTTRSEHAAVLLPNGQVLITGGYNSGGILNSAELYDPVTDSFLPTGHMAMARVLHTATVLANGKVLIAGGTSGDGYPVDSAEIYDPATGEFSPTGKMQSARLDHRATLLANGQVLITGGTGLNPPVPLASAELFDATTGQFTGQLLMSDPRDAHTSTMLNNGEVLIVGGGVASADIYK